MRDGQGAEAGRDATVLVVDDESSLRQVFVRWIRNNGWEALSAGDGSEALELLDDSVDVVLLDRNMPGVSGDAVLRELRARGLDCRVALVTAIEPELDILEMPFDEYVRKPVDERALVGMVERLLVRSAYDEAAREHLAALDKLATLEATHGTLELEESEQYRALKARVEEGQDNVRAVLTDIGPREALKEL